MQTESTPSRIIRLVTALLLTALPALIFYYVLVVNAVRIPILDDYDVILSGVNTISVSHGVLPKLLYILTAQHNGYKLMFVNMIILAQYSMLGRVEFLPLVEFGNAFAALIFIVVISMTRISRGNTIKRLYLLLPVAYLIFQLQYASALDFAMCSLQQLTVIFFSLLSIYLLARGSRWSFALACIALVLGISSSPNGFFVVPVGLLMLAQTRRWLRMPAWIVTPGLMFAVYLFRYGHAQSPEMQQGSAGSLLHFNIIYALSFLGSSAARFVSLVPSLALGLILCGVFLCAAKRGYFYRNPAVFYSMLFILINAIAISGLRSDMGLAQSLASRYRTYSNLFLAFSYIFLIEDILPLWKKEAVRRVVLVAGAALSVAFCLLSDVAGAHFLRDKKLALTHSYKVEWMKDPTAIHDAGVKGNPAFQNQMDKGNFDVRVPIMKESVRLGVYRPPLDLP